MIFNCFLNMRAPSAELRWSLQRLIFEAKTHGGGQTAYLMHFWSYLDRPLDRPRIGP